ncbi:hypothetical protein EJA71_10545 [Pseudomonas sp. PB106]|nr:hypothetical protein EJA71_10545 [Pseudomonas sp. PB106]
MDCHQSQPPLKTNVGASLLAKAPDQPTQKSTDPPPSRAISLPQSAFQLKNRSTPGPKLRRTHPKSPLKILTKPPHITKPKP